MQQRAVVIGVEDYASSEFSALPATTRDATAIAGLLSDSSENGMSVRLCTRNSIGTSRSLIEAEIESALASDASLVVIYFSGHGTLSRGGDFGQLVVSDDRIDMYWLMARIHAHNGRYRSTVVILDCCHAGAMGAPQLDESPEVEIERGVTILAASDSQQVALESADHGVFSQLLIQGLEGACADQDGRITPALLYTYIDQAMGAKDQRPVFATNIQRSPVLRHLGDEVDKLGMFHARGLTPNSLTSNPPGLNSGPNSSNPMTDAPISAPVASTTEGAKNSQLQKQLQKPSPKPSQKPSQKPSGVLAGFAAGVLLSLGALALWFFMLNSDEEPVAPSQQNSSEPQQLSQLLQRVNGLVSAPQLPTFVLIPAGEFTQGNRHDPLSKDQSPEKLVAVDEFLMSTTEITFGQYQQLTGDDTQVLMEPYQTADHPVVRVSWHQAHGYANALAQYYRDAGVVLQCTLPTESEWEYAARAGSDTPWHWGDNQNIADDYAWLVSNASVGGEVRSHAVAQKKPNAFGLFDTSGNVWEWVDDCYASYDNPAPVASWLAPTADDASTTSCQRVRRGGAFDNHVVTLMSATRGKSEPDTQRNAIGFRVACRHVNEPS